MSSQSNIITDTGGFPVSTNWNSEVLSNSGHGFGQMQSITDSLQATFLKTAEVGSTPIEIVPVIRTTVANEWMMNILLLIMALMVFLWFIMPRKKSILQQLRQAFSIRNSWTSEVPSYLFSGFYYVNFLIVVALFISLIVEQLLQKENNFVSLSTLLLLTLLVFFAYSLYKLLMIVLTGFIFKTQHLALQQFRLYINLDNLTGFVLMPLLLLMLTTQWDSLSYLGFLILLIANIFKWFQTISIGKSISQFKLYHLIIYLCTLEIIPVLLLLKLMSNLFLEQA